MIIWFTEVNFLFLPQSQLAGGLEGAIFIGYKKDVYQTFLLCLKSRKFETYMKIRQRERPQKVFIQTLH